MIHFTRILISTIFFSLTACNNLPTVKTSLWQLKAASVTINNSPAVFFETRLFLAEKNKEVCLVYNNYFGDLLISSTLYQGTISRGRVDVYEKKSLFQSGETVWKIVEPIEILVGKSDLALRFEKPIDPNNADLHLFKKMNHSISDNNSEKVARVPEVDVKAECENLLLIKISDQTINTKMN